MEHDEAGFADDEMQKTVFGVGTVRAASTGRFDHNADAEELDCRFCLIRCSNSAA